MSVHYTWQNTVYVDKVLTNVYTCVIQALIKIQKIAITPGSSLVTHLVTTLICTKVGLYQFRSKMESVKVAGLFFCLHLMLPIRRSLM